MKTSWNLGLLYKNHNDPQIEKDVVVIERAFKSFEKKYRGKTDYLKNETKLFKALSDFESMLSGLAVSKPLSYFNYAQHLNSADSEARAKSTQLTERFAKMEHYIVFFELDLAKIAPNFQKKFLASKKLKHFKFYLKNIFDRAKYNLSEPEEKIMGLKSIPAYNQWVEAIQKMLAKQTVLFQGKEMPLSEAAFRVHDLPLPERRELHTSMMKVLESLSDFAESEINAVVTNKKINDELRGYKEPYDATILGYQNDRKTVLAMVDSVTKHFSISHRFYNLKAKLLKLPNLEYSDRAVGIGENVKKLPFAESVKMLGKLFNDLDPAFAEILNKFLENGQIDVFPKVGKSGGAFCSKSHNSPTFVFLNDTETIDSLSTFAHEMGHAIHSELAKDQSALYEDYSIATAEVASTLFEAFAFDAMFKTLSDKEKIVALHNKINDDVQTVFRQVACFNFEIELHKTIRTKGGMSKEEIRAMMNKHMSAYLGPITKMNEIDGNLFVSWHHIRSFFYVYSYAFGQLVSKALYAKYKQDKNYINSIKKFFMAGGSDTPENIFKSIGIDVTKPDFFILGLKTIDDDISRLEKLTKKV